MCLLESIQGVSMALQTFFPKLDSVGLQVALGKSASLQNGGSLGSYELCG